MKKRKIHSTEQGLQRAMKRGELHIEARLDLHGMNSEQAKECFDDFMEEVLEEGKRYLLIITGKGTGVLQNALKQWVRNSNFSNWVRYFQSAHIKHGGDGAYYLILRRKKDF